MQIMRNKGLLFVLLAIASGCQTKGTPPSPTDSASAAVHRFEQLVRDRGSVTFRSYNGIAFRMDSDTELTFYPDHSAHMFEWGLGLERFMGTYHVHSDGCIVTAFKDFPEEWPVTVVYQDGDALLLRSYNAGANFVMGARGAATTPGGKVSYWPFRILTGDQEKGVLDMIKKSGER